MFGMLQDMANQVLNEKVNAKTGGNCGQDAKTGGNCELSQEGGKRRKARKAPKLSVREKLNAMNVDKLRAKAVKLGIRTTKRKDGKIVPLKKSTLVEKLAKHV